MQATAPDVDLTPPPPQGGWRPWALALLAHALLALALSWGIAWQHDTPVVASAELWAALPQVAAPRASTSPPMPPAPTAPAPPPAAPPAPAEPAPRPADIVLQRQRDEQQRLQAQRLAEERAARERAERERAERERLAREQAARDKVVQQKAAQERAAREQAARQQAERERQQQAQLEAERQRNLERMLGQANASGGPAARGSAERDAAPSASYAGRLVAHIRPNIVFTDAVPGNPRAEVEVRAAPDGTILSSRLLTSSGHRAWDDAVLRAIERTARLPRDENGRVPPTLILGFRPNE